MQRRLCSECRGSHDVAGVAARVAHKARVGDQEREGEGEREREREREANKRATTRGTPRATRHVLTYQLHEVFVTGGYQDDLPAPPYVDELCAFVCVLRMRVSYAIACARMRMR